MIDSTFYDKNWTVLNKIRYLEKWFSSNSIDLNTLSLSSRQDGEKIIVGMTGTNFEGKEIVLDHLLEYDVVRGEKGEQGSPIYIYKQTIDLEGSLGNNDIRYIQANDIKPTGFKVGDTLIVFLSYSDEYYIALYDIKSIADNRIEIELITYLKWLSSTGNSGSSYELNVLPYTVSVDLSTQANIPLNIEGNINLIPGNSYMVKGKYGINGTEFMYPLPCIDQSGILGEAFKGIGGLYSGESRKMPYFGDNGMGIQFILLTKSDGVTEDVIEGKNTLVIGLLEGVSATNENNPIIIEEIIDLGIINYLHRGTVSITSGDLTGTIPFNFILTMGYPMELTFEEIFNQMVLQHGFGDSSNVKTLVLNYPFSNTASAEFSIINGVTRLTMYEQDGKVLDINTTVFGESQIRSFSASGPLNNVYTSVEEYKIYPIYDLLNIGGSF